MDLNDIMKLAGNPQVQQLLKSLLGQFMGGGQGQQANMQGLVSQLEQAGLGPQVQSWLSGGPNQEVTGQQIQEALGTSNLDQMASQAGLPPEEAAHDLAKVLPEIVNQASPQGQLPTPEAGGQQLDIDALLKQVLGGLTQGPKQ